MQEKESEDEDEVDSDDIGTTADVIDERSVVATPPRKQDFPLIVAYLDSKKRKEETSSHKKKAHGFIEYLF